MTAYDELRHRVAMRFGPHQPSPWDDLTINAERAATIAVAVIKPDLDQLLGENRRLRLDCGAAATTIDHLRRQTAHLRIERDAAVLLSGIRRELLRQAVNGLAETMRGPL